MFDNQIREMAIGVASDLGLNNDKDLNVIELALHRYWRDRMAVTWTIEDVRSRAQAIGKGKITKTQARNILDEIHHHHDGSIGINWDVIDNEIIDQIP